MSRWPSEPTKCIACDRSCSEQQQRFRGQRRELQLWVDRRYDEIQARTSRLIARERELDRLEAEFERQSMQWQRQREAYRQEIEQLTRSHDLADASAGQVTAGSAATDASPGLCVGTAPGDPSLRSLGRNPHSAQGLLQVAAD